MTSLMSNVRPLKRDILPPMKIKSLTYLVLLLLVNGASAQSLYLSCKATSFPNLNFKTIYKVPPANARDQYLSDMIDQGLASVIVNKSESWVIKLPEAHISSPQRSGPEFLNAEITETRISANTLLRSGNFNSYDLDRITGKLTYQINLAEEVRNTWNKKHGGTLPILWTWEQVCTSASRPKI